MSTTTAAGRPPAPSPAPRTSLTEAAAWARRALAQSVFEARTILRNGEQLLVTVALPLVVLLGLAQSSVVELTTDGARRIDLVTPGVLALAIMATSFTSQAIAVAFDRRNGVLRLLATTPLGRSGLLTGKVLGVLAVEVVQIVLVVVVGLALGWSPDLAGTAGAVLAWLLGTAAFTALALLIAGTLRAEGVLAVANLVLVALIAVGGVVIPPAQLPGWLEPVATYLPSGALGEAMRDAFQHGGPSSLSLLVLAAWALGLGAAVTRTFRWQ